MIESLVHKKIKICVFFNQDKNCLRFIFVTNASILAKFDLFLV